MVRPIFFLLDRSGSMELNIDATIEGFNTFLSEQKTLFPDSLMTLWQFDHEILVSYENMQLCDVPFLNRETFVPRGSTALMDALGTLLKQKPVGEPPMVIIFTDGQDNHSVKYTNSHIHDLIEQKTSDGWSFIYLGANQDAFAEANIIGIHPANAVDFDMRDTHDVFRGLSATVSQRY
jgi:uncharacterized protein YegL